MSTVAGLHVPVIPFVDVFVSVGTVPPAQIVIDVPKLNTGVMIGSTVTLKVTGVAQGLVGVNV